MPLTADVLGCEDVKAAKTLHTSGPVWGSAVPVCRKPPIAGETEVHSDKTACGNQNSVLMYLVRLTMHAFGKV